jgi:hypothetical protein
MINHNQRRANAVKIAEAHMPGWTAVTELKQRNRFNVHITIPKQKKFSSLFSSLIIAASSIEINGLENPQEFTVTLVDDTSGELLIGLQNLLDKKLKFKVELEHQDKSGNSVNVIAFSCKLVRYTIGSVGLVDSSLATGAADNIEHTATLICLQADQTDDDF